MGSLHFVTSLRTSLDQNCIKLTIRKEEVTKKEAVTFPKSSFIGCFLPLIQ